MINLGLLLFLSLASGSLQQVPETIQHLHAVKNLTLGFQGDLSKSTVKSHSKQVMCVLDSWAKLRKGHAEFSPNDIDPTLCTHVVFRLVEIKNTNGLDNYELKDNENDDPESISVLYRQTIRLKEKKPELKLILSVGGWIEGTRDFQAISANRNLRSKFAANVADFLRKHSFDGVNIEWMWPVLESRNGKPDDRFGVTDLISSLSRVLRAQQFEVALTVPAEISVIEAGYNIPALESELDYLIILGQDLFANWRGVTGHHSALFGQAERNVGNTVRFILGKNISPRKVILGIPFVGRTFLLKNPETAGSGLGAPVYPNSGIQGGFESDYQVFGYHEICYDLKNESNGWTVYEDDEAKVPFMRDAKGNWVCFEDVKSVQAKVEFGEERGLGGYAAWSVPMDDFKGKWCDGKVNFPMLRTINYVLSKDSPSRGASQNNYPFLIQAILIVLILNTQIQKFVLCFI